MKQKELNAKIEEEIVMNNHIFDNTLKHSYYSHTYEYEPIFSIVLHRNNPENIKYIKQTYALEKILREKFEDAPELDNYKNYNMSYYYNEEYLRLQKLNNSRVSQFISNQSLEYYETLYHNNWIKLFKEIILSLSAKKMNKIPLKSVFHQHMVTKTLLNNIKNAKVFVGENKVSLSDLELALFKKYKPLNNLEELNTSLKVYGAKPWFFTSMHINKNLNSLFHKKDIEEIQEIYYKLIKNI